MWLIIMLLLINLGKAFICGTPVVSDGETNVSSTHITPPTINVIIIGLSGYALFPNIT